MAPLALHFRLMCPLITEEDGRGYRGIFFFIFNDVS
jgi:hypothetical protein